MSERTRPGCAPSCLLGCLRLLERGDVGARYTRRDDPGVAVLWRGFHEQGTFHSSSGVVGSTGHEHADGADDAGRPGRAASMR